MKYGSWREARAASKTYRKVIKIIRKELGVKIKGSRRPKDDFLRVVRKLKRKQARR